MGRQRVLQTFMQGRVDVLVGDITAQEVDAIVNAANSSLMGGGGVDGAIHAAGGPLILQECRELRRTSLPDGLPTGQAVITGAGLLPARSVIHAVGPMYGVWGGREPELLRSCYLNSLTLAVEHGFESIAFPTISTGIYGYPKDEAAAVSSQAIQEFLVSDDRLKLVNLVFFSSSDAKAFLAHHSFTEIDYSSEGPEKSADGISLNES